MAGKSGISQARTRLGVEPVKRLHDETVAPIASKSTRGAWYREWRLASLDGSTLDVADTKENEGAFGRPGASRGSSAYPRIRFVSLVENGTHVLFGSRMGDYQTGEITLAKELAAPMRSGLGDRERTGRTQDPENRGGSKIVLRSKTPELVRQEFYGLMMAHFAVRGLMHEAALKADIDPDELSFVHSVRVVRRKLPLFVAIPPSEAESVS